MDRSQATAPPEKNGVTTGPSRRFPYSSTPSGSPVSNITERNFMQDQKASMKLPIRSITTRTEFQQGHDTTTGSISPINTTSHSNVSMYTLPRGGDQQQFTSTFMTDKCGEAESRNGSKRVFPYPPVTAYDGMDSGEILCNSLNILSRLQEVQMQKKRLQVPKKKEKADNQVFHYFPKETFKSVNSEASLYALHLLFSTLNAKEAEQRFRDCWPVYEKKSEGIFRRMVLEWLKEIITTETDQANTPFFRDIQLEALAGLLVNPGGERFISFMRQFCRFVMYTVAVQRNGSNKVLKPAIPTSDPEITNRQLQILKTRTEHLHERTLKTFKGILKNDTVMSDSIKVAAEISDQVNCTAELMTSRLNMCIRNNPDLFGTPSEGEMKAREELLLNVNIKTIIDDWVYEDFLRDRVNAQLQRKTENIYKPVSLLQDIMEDYGKIWCILEMNGSKKKNVLDWKQLFPPPLQNQEGGASSINTFVDVMINSVNGVLSDEYLNGSVPHGILKDFNKISLRLNYLRMLESKIKTRDENQNASAIEFAKRNRDVLKLNLDQYDWRTLSQTECDNLGSLLDMTPLRVFDINRTSKRTSGINRFLDSPLESISEEHSIVIKRRKASNKPLTRATIIGSKDRTDSSKQLNGQSERSKLEPLCLSPLSSLPESSKSVTFQSGVVTPSMNTSASFDDTPTSLDVSNLSTRSTSFANATGNVSTMSSAEPEQLSNTPALNHSRMSISSEASTPVGLDTSTQERVSRLLDSVALRPSLSPILQSSSGATADKELQSNRESFGANLSELCNREPSSISCFDGTSLCEDWEDAKGIMEMSHSELFRNSDSDD